MGHHAEGRDVRLVDLVAEVGVATREYRIAEVQKVELGAKLDGCVEGFDDVDCNLPRRSMSESFLLKVDEVEHFLGKGDRGVADDDGSCKVVLLLYVQGVSETLVEVGHVVEQVNKGDRVVPIPAPPLDIRVHVCDSLQQKAVVALWAVCGMLSYCVGGEWLPGFEGNLGVYTTVA